ncbi:uncharacterized protein EV420DRAFT_1478755 [Desarmillaria tabescens]|uniref:Uncharacterized protein n=1 Tax=Armillaria tabescens TaxID=1929756 RepID=A0AA39KG90_ARMTA|nr:uncharacterized protein EV420DRAFT_1478755 [Desarmillaria tabescens]KAK0460238.1 hypothetical protein EV420DRAFT_1478755 [Desarmillaria tabescens]
MDKGLMLSLSEINDLDYIASASIVLTLKLIYIGDSTLVSFARCPLPSTSAGICVTTNRSDEVASERALFEEWGGSRDGPGVVETEVTGASQERACSLKVVVCVRKEGRDVWCVTRLWPRVEKSMWGIGGAASCRSPVDMTSSAESGESEGVNEGSEEVQSGRTMALSCMGGFQWGRDLRAGGSLERVVGVEEQGWNHRFRRLVGVIFPPFDVEGTSKEVMGSGMVGEVRVSLGVGELFWVLGIRSVLRGQH